MGVMSLVAESVVRTNWLSGIEATTTEDVIGLTVLWDCNAMRVVVIGLMAFQSSSLSSMKPWKGMVA